MTKEEYMVFHEQLLKKLNKLTNLCKATNRTSKNGDDERERILPEFPLTTVDQLENFEELLKKSSQARDSYVRIIQDLILLLLKYNKK